MVGWKPSRTMINNKRRGFKAQGQMEQKTKSDSASEITSPYDAIHLNLKGSCRADGSRGGTAILNKCTYNVRTLCMEDSWASLINKVDQIEWDVTDLCKTYRQGEGFIIHHFCWRVFSLPPTPWLDKLSANFSIISEVASSSYWTICTAAGVEASVAPQLAWQILHWI